MSRRLATRLVVVLVLAGIAVLYVSRLGRSPAYLSIEEVSEARHSLALATTGRSASGQRWPLYFVEPGNEAGRDPLFIYLTAAVLTVSPFSESTVRLTSALFGFFDVVLMFVLARRIFGTDWSGLIAAVMLATTPAHFFQSRIATQQIGVIAFVLMWLCCLSRYLETHRSRDLFVATASLGVGIYSYVAADVVMPLYLLLSLVVVVIESPSQRLSGDTQDVPSRRTRLSVALVGFALALVPFIVWHLGHTGRLLELVDYYTHNGYNTDLGTKTVANTLVTRLDTWWNAFSPDKLFFTGDSSLRFSTKQTGFFLVPVAIFFPIGLVRLKRAVRRELLVVIVAALILGPLPAVLVSDHEIKRWLTFVPFVILTSTAGVLFALESPRRIRRLAASALLLLGLLQFVGFVHYYWGQYRVASSFYFGRNLRGAIDEVLTTAADPGCVFFDSRVLYMSAHWELYARARGREDLAAQTNVVDAESLGFAVPSTCQTASLVVFEDDVRSKRAVSDRLEAQGWRKTLIPESDGAVYLAVYRRAWH